MLYEGLSLAVLGVLVGVLCAGFLIYAGRRFWREVRPQFWDCLISTLFAVATVVVFLGTPVVLGAPGLARDLWVLFVIVILSSWLPKIVDELIIGAKESMGIDADREERWEV
ncbi:hypothetical protein HY374_00435 [Candidatus Berkelbacteria bacterium]|nr:hypothetical protein [Candidatus Berkelbacteria bacterium]